MKNLTPKQAAVLRVIIGRMDRDGVCPSYQEISDELGLNSKGRVWQIISGLVERGYLGRATARSRALTVLRKPDDGAWIRDDDLLRMTREMLRGAIVMGEYTETLDVRLDRSLWETLSRELEDRV